MFKAITPFMDYKIFKIYLPNLNNSQTNIDKWRIHYASEAAVTLHCTSDERHFFHYDLI